MENANLRSEETYTSSQILELWEERAAIREYLGGYERKEAERLAWQDIRLIMKNGKSC